MPAKYALCIGINTYPGTGRDLAGCINDAEDWASLLDGLNFSGIVLKDEQATKSAIMMEVSKMVAGLTRDDTAILTYSGHGSYVADKSTPDGRREVMCPTDVIQGNVIGSSELQAIFRSRSQGSRLVFIDDSCYSAGMDRVLDPYSQKGFANRSRFLDPSLFKLQLQPTLNNRALPAAISSQALIMAACRADQTAKDAEINGRMNGAFSRAAIDSFALISQPGTYSAWMEKICTLLPTPENPQQPCLEGNVIQRLWKALG